MSVCLEMQIQVILYDNGDRVLFQDYSKEEELCFWILFYLFRE